MDTSQAAGLRSTDRADRRDENPRKTEEKAMRMSNLNEVFGFKEFCGSMTATQLKRRTEYIQEYEGYSIAFGKCQEDADGRFWWSIRVWKNEGKERYGVFTTDNLCATDGDAHGNQVGKRQH